SSHPTIPGNRSPPSASRASRLARSSCLTSLWRCPEARRPPSVVGAGGVAVVMRTLLFVSRYRSHGGPVGPIPPAQAGGGLWTARHALGPGRLPSRLGARGPRVRWRRARPWPTLLLVGGAAPGGAAELGEGAEEAAGEVGGAELLQDRGDPARVEAAGAGGDIQGDVVADGHQLAVELVGGP